MNEFKLLPKIYNWQLWRNKITPNSGYTPPYKVYTALLTQTGTNAPVANVLENTFDSVPLWSRDSTGYYICTLNGKFDEQKTSIFIGADFISSNPVIYQIQKGNIDYLGLYVYDVEANNGADDLLYNTSIEIRVYN